MKVKVFKIRISEEFLLKDQQELNEFLQNNRLVKSEAAFIQDEGFWSIFLYYDNTTTITNVRETKSKKYSAEDDVLNSDEIKILDSLKIWRSEKAKEQNLPSYFIASNQELLSVAKFRPAKKEELQEIKGFGKHKIENYGSEIIEIVAEI